MLDLDKIEFVKLSESNSFFWEAKQGREMLLHIGLNTILNFSPNFDDDSVNCYSLYIYRNDEIYAKETIYKLAEIVKKNINAKDEIIIKKHPKFRLEGGETVLIEFCQFN